MLCSHQSKEAPVSQRHNIKNASFCVKLPSMKHWFALPAVLLMLGIPGSVGNQTPELQKSASVEPSTGANPNEARVYVTAKGRSGKAMTLKPSDIAIEEEKTAVKIDQVVCGRPDPLLLGILLDASGSRRQDLLLSSHYEAIKSFLPGVLGENDKAHIVGFDDEPYPVTEVTDSRALLGAALDKLRETAPRGSTALYDAIKFAAATNFGVQGRRAIVIVADFDDNASHTTFEKAVEALWSTGTAVYAIVDAADGGPLRKNEANRADNVAHRLAMETGGEAFSVHGKEQFAKALDDIQNLLNNFCRIDYIPLRVGSKKGFAKLRVTAVSFDVFVAAPERRPVGAP